MDKYVLSFLIYQYIKFNENQTSLQIKKEVLKKNNNKNFFQETFFCNKKLTNRNEFRKYNIL